MTRYIACYLEPQRRGGRADQLIRAFAQGCGRHANVVRGGRFDERAAEHAVMSTWLTTQHVLRRCHERGLPFWHMDSCWIRPTTGVGYYRLTRNGCRPRLAPGRSLDRARSMGVELRPWRTSGEHILVCRQGPSAGKQWRAKPNVWNDEAIERLSTLTDRPVRVREKSAREHRKLAVDLKNAWAVVTHTSTCAVEAVIAGVPVFCAADSAAAAVGCEDITRIEAPPMPDREDWLAALAWEQFSIREYAAGLWRRTVDS